MSEFLRNETAKRLQEKKDSLFKVVAGSRKTDPITFRPTISFTIEYCMESGQDIRSLARYLETEYGENTVEHAFGEAIMKAITNGYNDYIKEKQ